MPQSPDRQISFESQADREVRTLYGFIAAEVNSSVEHADPESEPISPLGATTNIAAVEALSQLKKSLGKPVYRSLHQ